MIVKAYIILNLIYTAVICISIIVKQVNLFNSNKYYKIRGTVMDVQEKPIKMTVFENGESKEKEINKYYIVYYLYVEGSESYTDSDIVKYNIYKVHDRITIIRSKDKYWMSGKLYLNFWINNLIKMKSSFILLCLLVLQFIIWGMIIEG